MYSSDSGQRHVFYRGTDNGIYHVYFNPDNSRHGPEEWDPPLKGSLPGSVTGDPVTMYTAPTKQQHLFHVNGVHSLIHIYYDPSSNRRTTETWSRGDATGTPSTIYDSNGQQHVYYRGIDNGIYQVYYDPSFQGVGIAGTHGVRGPDQWASGAAGDPASLFTPNGQQHVFYRDGSGNIWHVYYDPPSNSLKGPEQWASGAAGDPASLYSANGQQHIFYRDGGGAIWHVYYDPPSNGLKGPEKWASGAAGDPATMFTPEGQQHMFYRDGSGNIWQVYYDPPSNGLKGPEGWATGAASDPATMYVSDNGQQNMFFRDGLGNIWQIYFEDNVREGAFQWV
jgi:catechol 2,3-dioxygenase-like lactoylglutathione lyase family enzyme